MNVDDYHMDLVGQLAVLDGIERMDWKKTRALSAELLKSGRPAEELTLREIREAMEQVQQEAKA